MTTAYKFSQHVRIADKNFPVGIHQVPEAIEAHPDFLHFVRCGYIHEAPPQKVAAQPVAINEMQKRMAKRIEQKLAANKAKIKKAAEQVREPVQGKEEEPSADPQGEDEENGQEFEPVSETDAEQVPEGDQDDGGEETDETKLTPQQKAARTRAAKKAAKEE